MFTRTWLTCVQWTIQNMPYNVKYMYNDFYLLLFYTYFYQTKSLRIDKWFIHRSLPHKKLNINIYAINWNKNHNKTQYWTIYLLLKDENKFSIMESKDVNKISKAVTEEYFAT